MKLRLFSTAIISSVLLTTACGSHQGTPKESSEAAPTTEPSPVATPVLNGPKFFLVKVDAAGNVVTKSSNTEIDFSADAAKVEAEFSQAADAKALASDSDSATSEASTESFGWGGWGGGYGNYYGCQPRYNYGGGYYGSYGYYGGGSFGGSSYYGYSQGGYGRWGGGGWGGHGGWGGGWGGGYGRRW